jgi:hypothetical protein
VRFASDVTQRGSDEGFIAVTGRFTELFVGPGDDGDRCRPAPKRIADSAPSTRRLCPFGSLPSQFPDEVFKLVIGEISEAAGGDVSSALVGCLVKIQRAATRSPTASLLTVGWSLGCGGLRQFRLHER